MLQNWIRVYPNSNQCRSAYSGPILASLNCPGMPTSCFKAFITNKQKCHNFLSNTICSLTTGSLSVVVYGILCFPSICFTKFWLFALLFKHLKQLTSLSNEKALCVMCSLKSCSLGCSFPYSVYWGT